MDNLEDSENNAKVSDSAYSNSCSNSQSRRSRSSKSTHSGSNSSGSSGYGGKPSTNSSSKLDQPKKGKDVKKKKLPQVETIVTDVVVETEISPPEPAPDFDEPKEETPIVTPTPSPPVQADGGVENMERSDINNEQDQESSQTDGFSCVISMHDGVVMYTATSLTATLGFPKDMWIGRSFIDFVHPRDRETFASQISDVIAPKKVHGSQIQEQSPANSESTIVCRIRQYRGLVAGFGVKEKSLSFTPFLLKLTFKNIDDEEGKVTYLVVQALPFISAFKIPYEMVSKPIPFMIRHAANGNIEHVDPESVPILGYIPQDLLKTDALQLYHPEDLIYIRQVYEIIVREGGLPRSRAYRMISQNGDYVKLETEWTSFTNPCSRQLEFIIGKHFIVQGPANPDVFQTPEKDKLMMFSDEVQNKAGMLRENIVRIMNKVLTKPAEVVKQQMTKRCQEIASFMETFMEHQPKTDEECRIDIQEPDNSHYERDTMMLGGISPHHDYNDSQSSTETPLSYTQLNYNETLQRYFDSHQPYSYEDYNTTTGENIFELNNADPVTKYCKSPRTDKAGPYFGMPAATECNVVANGSTSPVHTNFMTTRLTETLLNKHNADMEKELKKIHRGTRSSKEERDKANNSTRQKKIEHLVRCNTPFQPAASVVTSNENQPHGVKRSWKHMDADNNSHRHQCAQRRRTRQRTMSSSPSTTNTPSLPVTTTADTKATPWQTNPVSMNGFIMGVGMPQQMSLMNPVPAMPGMFPMYYAPAPISSVPSSMPTTSGTTTVNPFHQNAHGMHFQPAPMPCMMYGHPMYGQPFMYHPPMNHIHCSMPHRMVPPPVQYNGETSMYPLGLTNSNYEAACTPSVTLRSGKSTGAWRDKRRSESSYSSSSKIDLRSTDRIYSTIALNRSTEAVSSSGPTASTKLNKNGNSDDMVDKTDGESSYSSFYSSFFRTESGSAEESGDAKKSDSTKFRNAMNNSNYDEPKEQRVLKRKMEPPWMEKVSVTSELIYKYQIVTKPLEEVLTADKLKIKHYEQPSLVNEQLGQLYLDLHLEGAAARLTLEEGITSSSSSGEETAPSSTYKQRKKHEYSKLVMIYEEDAPWPPPDQTEIDPEPCCSTATAY